MSPASYFPLLLLSGTLEWLLCGLQTPSSPLCVRSASEGDWIPGLWLSLCATGPSQELQVTSWCHSVLPFSCARCLHVCVPVCSCGGQGRMLCHSPRSLTEPGAGPAARKPHNPPVRASQSTGARVTSHVGAGDSNSGPHGFAASALTLRAVFSASHLDLRVRACVCEVPRALAFVRGDKILPALTVLTWIAEKTCPEDLCMRHQGFKYRQA